MFALTIKQKILLAEKVMGWKNYHSHGSFDNTLYDVSPNGEDGNTFLFVWEKGNWREWRPEANKGDAAELLMALPSVVLCKVSNGEIKASMGKDVIESNSFCETICRIALACAEDLKNEQ